jgi:hypothetical protein
MRKLLFTCLASLLAITAQASTGLTELTGLQGDGPVTVFYPSSSQALPLQRGPFALNVAWQGTPARGNGRLVVISHGSGGAPWTHADLARTLVDAGFIVALPEHHGDNYKDTSSTGPASWKLRPAEVHSGPVLKACTPCERVADLPTAGHGALLSPPPPIANLGAIAADLLGDPPGFDRAVLPQVDRQITAFLRQHLRP